MSDKKNLLNDVDEKFEKKGNGFKTLWQFIKFTLVSCLATIIQLVLVNVLCSIMNDYKEPLPEFLNHIFRETTVGIGNNNWGYILPFFISNFIANTVGYFLNKSKTFKSDAPIWHFVLYIVILFSLILFSTWLQGVVYNALNNTGIQFLVNLSATLAGMVAGTIQFVVLFPIQKFVLLKEEKN